MNAAIQTGFDYIYSENSQGRFGISEMVFRKIWESIVTQEIPPGEKITEEFLSQTFEVSRTPLREAVQRLVEIGMIVKQNNRAIIVSELNRKNMRDLSVVREHLEGLIAFEIWQKNKAGEISLDTLKEWNERMNKFATMEDAAMVVECGLAFHQEMRALSDNRVAKMALEKVLLGLETYRRMMEPNMQRCHQVISEHSDFLKALEGDNSEKVEHSMRTHLRNSAEAIIAILPE
ncbi:GntR family transcriptional regulator [Marinicella sp. W31]|uniref:GntR family transcriptional regulator n=1 Tax=Marinicella sp. W31 TaxID=3023713 RepID=UPI003756ABF0